MAKTKLTLQLEKEIHNATKRLGLVGCFEVSIGKGGKERVDYLTIDSKQTVRCYEVKVTKSDFNSKCKNSFVGHYNYYVMPFELFVEVGDDIPNHIGVYCGDSYGFVKNPKRHELKVDFSILQTSLCFALYRESVKGWNSKDIEFISRLNSKVSDLENKLKCEKSDNKDTESESRNIRRWLRKNGFDWNEILDKMEES